MKFANQQAPLFIENGSPIAYLLGLHALANALACQFFNIYLLTYQPSIEESILYFVALFVIMEFTQLYYESLSRFRLKAVMHEPVHRMRSGQDINFCERSCFHMFARVLYRVVRILYVSVVFYYIPYSVVLMYWLTPNKRAGSLEGAKEGHGE